MSRPLLALTLRHPWPWMITSLPAHPKRIENRTWKPTGRLAPGDWFAIHGGAAPKAGTKAGDAYRDAIADDVDEAQDHFTIILGSLPSDAFFPAIEPPVVDESLDRLFDVGRFIAPGIVAVAKFGGTVEESDDPWFEGPIGWVLSEVMVLPEPVPCRGAQGLWSVPEDVAVLVRDGFKLAIQREAVSHAKA